MPQRASTTRDADQSKPAQGTTAGQRGQGPSTRDRRKVSSRDKERAATATGSTEGRTFVERMETGVWGLGILAAGVLILLALLSYNQREISDSEPVSNWIGPVGLWLAHILLSAAGLAAFLLVLATLYTGSMIIWGRMLAVRVRSLLASLMVLVPFMTLAALIWQGTNPWPQGAGGWIGLTCEMAMSRLVGTTGTVLVAVAVLVAGLSLLLRVHVQTILEVTVRPLARLARQRTAAREQAAREKAIAPAKGVAHPQPVSLRRYVPAEENEPVFLDVPTSLVVQTPQKSLPMAGPNLSRDGEDATVNARPGTAKQIQGPSGQQSPVKEEQHKTGSAVPIILPKGPVAELPFFEDDGDDEAGNESGVPIHRTEPTRIFELPDIGLLDFHPPVRQDINDEALQESARLLAEKLKDFRIDGEVTGIHPGPVITLFEFRPGRGIKVSQIASLSKDLAMALSAEQVRVIAPIPGKDVVGIEIPNRIRETVFLRELVASKKYKEDKFKLPLVLGKDIAGFPVISDLTKMPHLLIAGTTGSGKSVALHAFIMSILYRRKPSEVKFLFVDPKMLELTPYAEIPHLLLPVVKEAKEAVVALRWAVGEMERRNRLMSSYSVPNISEYNEVVRSRKAQAAQNADASAVTPVAVPRPGKPAQTPAAAEEELEELPFIVVIIDELADLMMVAGKQVEQCIARLAQMARAAGIHMIIATQNPTVKVVTGIIKANLPARISFKVRTMQDSRVILDQNGADDLLGYGDMLFLGPGSSNLQRIHGAFVSTEERIKVVEYLRSQGAPEYNFDIMQSGDDSDENDGDDALSPRDELYDQAKRYAIAQGRISTSALQRELGIGYNKAAVIMAKMEKEGLVGPQEAAGKPRIVLR